MFNYFIEKNPRYLDIVKPVFLAIDAGDIDAITSTITLLEVLVLPFRQDNQALVERYRSLILYSEGLTTYEVFHEVSVLSAQLRGRYSIRIPDAIQIATGQLYGAEAFLTNDAGLKNIKEIRVLVLDDFAGHESAPSPCS
jgi:predicted nucleic acid-binding protein